MKISRMILVSTCCLFQLACSSLMPMSDKDRCQVLMDEAWQDLTSAKLSGISSAWQLTKASKFLAQAKVKYELERYDLCIDKAREAKALLSQLKN